MSDENAKDEKFLEPFFAAAREAPPEVSDDLMARVLADAAASVPRDAPLPERAPRRGAFAQILDGIGGWPSIAGLVTATAAGLWFGFADPYGLVAGTTATTGFDVTEVLPGYGDLGWIEG